MDWWRDNFWIILAAAILLTSAGLGLILFCACRRLLRQGTSSMNRFSYPLCRPGVCSFQNTPPHRTPRLSRRPPTRWSTRLGTRRPPPSRATSSLSMITTTWKSLRTRKSGPSETTAPALRGAAEGSRGGADTAWGPKHGGGGGCGAVPGNTPSLDGRHQRPPPPRGRGPRLRPGDSDRPGLELELPWTAPRGFRGSRSGETALILTLLLFSCSVLGDPGLPPRWAPRAARLSRPGPRGQLGLGARMCHQASHPASSARVGGALGS